MDDIYRSVDTAVDSKYRKTTMQVGEMVHMMTSKLDSNSTILEPFMQMVDTKAFDETSKVLDKFQPMTQILGQQLQKLVPQLTKQLEGEDGEQLDGDGMISKMFKLMNNINFDGAQVPGTEKNGEMEAMYEEVEHRLEDVPPTSPDHTPM